MAAVDNPCPHDGRPMLVWELEGVDLDSCAECGGTWLDAGEIEHVSELSGVPAGPLSAALKSAPSGRRSGRRCPRCGKRLRAVTLHGAGDPVEVDRCPRGHGLFLDRGEMEAVIAAFDDGEGAAVGAHLADLFRSRREGHAGTGEEEVP